MKKNNDYADRIIEELRDPDDNVLDLLEGRTRDEIKRMIQEELSPDWLKFLREDAEDKGNDEVLLWINKVEAAFLDHFTWRFLMLMC
jgi:hypothetical protein